MKATLDWLLSKEVVRDHLRSILGLDTLNSGGKILQDHSGRDIGVPLLDSLNLMSDTATHINKQNRIRITRVEARDGALQEIQARGGLDGGGCASNFVRSVNLNSRFINRIDRGETPHNSRQQYLFSPRASYQVLQAERLFAVD